MLTYLFFKYFFALCIGHAIADFPLQGEYLAKGKNRFLGVRPDNTPWYWCMGAHALVNAGAVWVITGVPFLALLEFLVHFLIDDRKCAGSFGPNTDQILHITCKAAWAILLALALTISL